jgi:hypothetical protein
MIRFASLPAFAIVLTSAAAHAQFAEPPDSDEPALAVDAEDDRDRDRDRGRDPYNYEDDIVIGPRSSLRVFTGPALRISDDAAEGGLFVALDVGARAAGARLSGTWIHAGSAGGASQYAGEIWVDFRDEDRIHPILAAGAGVARLDRVDQATGDVAAATIGIGLLRGSLQYRLPVRGVDARAALDVIGSLPAFGEAAEDASPWLTLSASVGVGF